ncbi:MAG: hypothetical protein CML29_17515 [Rhizobiales bacterium]|nr:hypothetical protein [Hyphomicrobiales bacterium]
MRIIPILDGVEESLAPDLLIGSDLMGDLSIAGDSEPGNRGGLAARHPLETAVTICLMSDARVDEDELRPGDVNRGWAGDSFDLVDGEAPIGSKLWLLRRRTVDDVHVPRLAEAYTLEALQPLIDQGAAAEATATAVADPARNRLELSVTLTDRAGNSLVDRKFSLLWDLLA